MTVKTIYHYDEDGKITARGKFDDERFDTVPKNSTLEELPDIEENETVRFDTDKEEWKVLADYRGEKFIDSNDEIHEITEIDVEPEDDWEVYEPEPSDEPSEEEKRITDLEESVAQIVGGE